MAATYGAPGVYIEEKPSGSMPIQGVGTSVAAFVGFTQRYDRTAGDPTDPDGHQAAAGHQLAPVRADLRRLRQGRHAAVRGPRVLRERRGAPATSSGCRPRPRIQPPMLALTAANRPELASVHRARVDRRRCPAEVEVVPPAPPRTAARRRTRSPCASTSGASCARNSPGSASARRPRRSRRRSTRQSNYIRVDVPDVSGRVRSPSGCPRRAGTRWRPHPPPDQVTEPTILEGSETERHGLPGPGHRRQRDHGGHPRPDHGHHQRGRHARRGAVPRFPGPADRHWCSNGETRMAILDTPPGLNATRGPGVARAAGQRTPRSPRSTTRTSWCRTAPATNGDDQRRLPDRAGLRAHRRRLGPHRRSPRRLEGAGQRGRSAASPGWRPTSPMASRPSSTRWGSTASARSAPWASASGARARCRQTDQSWRYINVRRLFNFIEESIRRGTQWAVFERTTATCGNGSSATSTRSCAGCGCRARWSARRRTRRSTSSATRRTTRRNSVDEGKSSSRSGSRR